MSSAIHARINDVLSIVVAILGMYLAMKPFYPELQFVYQKELTHVDEALQGIIDVPGQPVDEDAPADNRLIIPEILVDAPILVGDSPNLLHQGIWHRPHTSTPNEGGNSVFVAHRFQYTSGPNTFYHLDKVAVGEQFVIYWEKKKYTYEVFVTEVVEPDAVYIEYQSHEPIVTLYTCTPLWTAQKRLVVRAKLVS